MVDFSALFAKRHLNKQRTSAPLSKSKLSLLIGGDFLVSFGISGRVVFQLQSPKYGFAN